MKQSPSASKSLRWSQSRSKHLDYLQSVQIASRLASRLLYDGVIACLARDVEPLAVDAGDIAMLLGAWGTRDDDADVNGDGTVNAADLSIVLGGWGSCE